MRGDVRTARIVEPKRLPRGDQASRLRDLATPAESAGGPGTSEAPARLVVLSPQGLDDARARVARYLVRRAGVPVGEVGGQDTVSARRVRTAGAVVIAVGAAPSEVAQGLSLVRWVVGQRLGLPVGVVVVGEAGAVDRGFRRRLRATLERHSGRSDLVVAGLGRGRIDRRGRRSLGRMVAHLESRWHLVCGGVGL